MIIKWLRVIIQVFLKDVAPHGWWWGLLVARIVDSLVLVNENDAVVRVTQFSKYTSST